MMIPIARFLVMAISPTYWTRAKEIVHNYYNVYGIDIDCFVDLKINHTYLMGSCCGLCGRQENKIPIDLLLMQQQHYSNEILLITLAVFSSVCLRSDEQNKKVRKFGNYDAKSFKQKSLQSLKDYLSLLLKIYKFSKIDIEQKLAKQDKKYSYPQDFKEQYVLSLIQQFSSVSAKIDVEFSHFCQDLRNIILTKYSNKFYFDQRQFKQNKQQTMKKQAFIDRGIQITMQIELKEKHLQPKRQNQQITTNAETKRNNK